MPIKAPNLCVIGLPLLLMSANASYGHPPGPQNTANPARAGATLSVGEVRDLLVGQKEPVYIYDANERDSYLRGHVPGARWLQTNAVTAQDLPRAKDAKLIFYCYNPICGASEAAAERARALGYRNVWQMPEGIEGWRAANMPTVAGENAK
ncbi:MAG TPA: rhodanese-like domain-containing protein [Xanthobacteraceae bacterium]